MVLKPPEIMGFQLPTSTGYCRRISSTINSTPPKTNMSMENPLSNLKMYFLLNMGIFQCHLSFQGCISNFSCHTVTTPRFWLLSPVSQGSGARKGERWPPKMRVGRWFSFFEMVPFQVTCEFFWWLYIIYIYIYMISIHLLYIICYDSYYLESYFSLCPSCSCWGLTIVRCWFLDRSIFWRLIQAALPSTPSTHSTKSGGGGSLQRGFPAVLSLIREGMGFFGYYLHSLKQTQPIAPESRPSQKANQSPNHHFWKAMWVLGSVVKYT